MRARCKKMIEYESLFKNAQAETAYMAAYNRALGKWPVPYETKYVPTTYGDTHLIVSGPEAGDPLILMPGSCISATAWYPNIAALARTYRVYALDIIGDLGKSKVKKTFSNRSEVADWLTNILDVLDIEKAYMVGLSLGGFFTISYALEEPERLKKIILLAPAATFAPFIKGWHFGVMFPFMVGGLATDVYNVRCSASYAIESTCKFYNISKEELAKGIKNEDLANLILTFGEESLEELRERIDAVLKNGIKYCFAPGNFVENESLDQMLVGMKSGKMLLKFGPYVLPDEELKKLKLPTLLIYGDKEVMYDADRAIKRAKELVENIQTAVIPNASHMVHFEQPVLVNFHILNFLSEDT